MRKDRALAKEINTSLAGLHDSSAFADPFEWSGNEEDTRRRRAEFEALGERLSAYTHVSRAATVTKLLLFGTLLPGALFALFVWLDFPDDTGIRAWTWMLLLVAAFVSAVAAVATWWPSAVGEDISFALYAIPRGWSFSRLHGRAVWSKLRETYGYFDRGDDDQEIRARIWGHLDDERRRPFMMFVFHWVDIEHRPRYNASKKRVETRKVRIPRERHGIFVGMPEAQVRIRISETEKAHGSDSSIRLEHGALNKAADISCRKSDELEARKFLSPAVQEVLMMFSEGLPKMHLDVFPGHVLILSELEYLAGPPRIKLNRDGAGFESRIGPWIDGVETFRTTVDDGLRRIAKYND